MSIRNNVIQYIIELYKTCVVRIMKAVSLHDTRSFFHLGSLCYNPRGKEGVIPEYAQLSLGHPADISI